MILGAVRLPGCFIVLSSSRMTDFAAGNRASFCFSFRSWVDLDIVARTPRLVAWNTQKQPGSLKTSPYKLKRMDGLECLEHDLPLEKLEMFEA